MKIRFLIGLLAAVLSACGTPYIKDTTPPLAEQVKAGDSLEIKRTVEVPPYVQLFYFQFAEPIGTNRSMMGLSKYQSDCALRFSKPIPRRFVIEPQSLTITKVETFESDAMLDMKYFGIYLYVESARVANLQRIECRTPDESYKDTAFSSGKFEESFGDFITIKRR